MAIVYEHLRNDTNEVFYVGKGEKKKRAFDKSNRNPHWHNIVNKVGYTVNIVHKGVEQEEAKRIEILLIEKYGRKDLDLGNLVNMTDGGEGALGVIVSEKTRQHLRELNTGKTASEEARQKMSKAQKGKAGWLKGKTMSEETRKKISESLKGKTHTEKSKQKISEARKNMSEETKQKMSDAQKGKTMSEESRQKMSEAHRNKKGVKGYYFNKASKKWNAKIVSNKKTIHIGSFDTPEEASEAYQKARLIYFV